MNYTFAVWLSLIRLKKIIILILNTELLNKLCFRIVNLCLKTVFAELINDLDKLSKQYDAEFCEF